ncbi:hypothetical protein [Paenibacillus sp. JJ1722]|uniref:hypothetical protein n=1 Tax=Paenibacillus sp. JJ1722 TaxID=3398770 RepID=UPI003AADDD82
MEIGRPTAHGVQRQPVNLYPPPPPGDGLSVFTSQSLQTFARLLYMSGTVRSGGNYLYYEDVHQKWPQNPGIPFTAQILLTYAPEAPLGAYVNAADTVIGAAEETFYFLDALTSRKPAFPPGHAGLEIYRPAADETGNLVAYYLCKMFIQVGTKLEGGSSFIAQDLSDVPIAPLDQVTALPSTDIAGLWNHYRVVLPIVKHAIRRSMAEDCDYPADNPYAGLGEEVKFTFYPRDVLGNTLLSPSYTHAVPVLYRDFVLPPHQWPGTTLHYKLDDGGLVISLDFNSERLTKEQTSVSKGSYALAYHQLSQDYVSAGLTYSIDEATTHEDSILATLREYTRECWRKLCQTIPGLPIPRVVRELRIERSAIKLTVDKPLFALNLELTITRTYEDHIDPEMRSIPEAISASSRIPHESLKVADWSMPAQQTIQALARYFDASFGRKLARGAWVGGEEADQLWLVGIGNTESLSIVKQTDTFFYAAAPMETMKRRRTFNVTPYPSECSDGTDSADHSGTETVEDLDDWVQQIFAFVDKMLEAQDLSIIGKVDDGKSLEQIRAAKQALAESYVSQVKHLGYLKAAYHLKGARERFKQQMLMQLAVAYKQDTVVQQPIAIDITRGDPAEMKQIYCYGPIEAASFMGLPDGCEMEEGHHFPVQARFADAKLSLEKGIQHLTYLFDVKNTQHFAQYLAQKVKFKVTHLEYTSTEWIYYYTYKLRQEMSAQDRLKHEIVWNEEEILAKQNNEDELPQAMAQLIHHMPCIRDGLKQGADSGEPTIAVTVLKNELEQIVRKWKEYSKKPVSIASRGLLTTFDLEQPGFSSRLEIKLEGLSGPAVPGAFSMSIGPYRSVSAGSGVFQFIHPDNGQYLRFDQRNLAENLERTLIIDDFNILSLKKARVLLYETRNELLLRCCSSYTGATAAEFVYRTQRVTLPDAVTPRLRTAKEIDISNLTNHSSTDRLSVEDHMDNLLKQLFKDKDTKPWLHSLVCSAVYRYVYIAVDPRWDNDGNNLGQVTVPVCLKHARTYLENEESVAEFCRQINECLRRKDGPLHEEGNFILKLSVHSENGGNVNTLPVLVLENLKLPLNKIRYLL